MNTMSCVCPKVVSLTERTYNLILRKKVQTIELITSFWEKSSTKQTDKNMQKIKTQNTKSSNPERKNATFCQKISFFKGKSRGSVYSFYSEDMLFLYRHHVLQCLQCFIMCFTVLYSVCGTLQWFTTRFTVFYRPFYSTVKEEHDFMFTAFTAVTASPLRAVVLYIQLSG